MLGGASRYVFGGNFAAERDRLAAGERLWDSGTIGVLSEVGVRPGWRCLEVGAGLGSIARWLADQVGTEGDVTAVDVRVDWLEWLRSYGVTVSRLDVTRDPLPEEGFDLIHARLVLQHLPERRMVVRRLVDGLRSNGVLLLEDTDVAALFAHPSKRGFLAGVKRAAYAVMAQAGYEARCGLLNVEMMRQSGLAHVGAQGRSVVVRGGSDEARWYALWLEHLRARMLATATVTDIDIGRALEELADPANTWLSQVMIAAVGRGVASAPG